VNHAVRRTLLALFGGVAVQRLCQLASFVLVGRALGVAGLGQYAQGMALAAVLGVLAAAGIGNATARAIVGNPTAAGAIVRAAVRMRLRRGAALAALAGVGATLLRADPLLWWLCALHALPSAFDQKPALDACGRTRTDVRVESLAALLQLAAVAAACASGAASASAFAGIALAVRCAHAWNAARIIAALPGRDAAATLPRSFHGPAAGQAAHELLAIGDVWLVALALGDAAAGLYALGARLAAAALVPSAQLARLLTPHQLHAAHAGDGARTLAAALRATLLATLPVAAGGAVAAPMLCTLAGGGFEAATATLRLLLLAGCAQHLGWQCSLALLARRQDVAYAHGFAWPAVAHAAAIGLLPLALSADASAQVAATAAASVAAVAYTAYLFANALAAGVRRCGRPAGLVAALGVAAATALAAAAPSTLGVRESLLLAQLAAGGAAFAGGIWFVELRGRLGRIGDGLATASGFRN
jgi:O-antigen/teichoic acid export membrane protein